MERPLRVGSGATATNKCIEPYSADTACKSSCFTLAMTKAKEIVNALILQLGFFGIDLGPLSIGGRLAQFPGGPLPVLNLVKLE